MTSHELAKELLQGEDLLVVFTGLHTVKLENRGKCLYNESRDVTYDLIDSEDKKSEVEVIELGEEE